MKWDLTKIFKTIEEFNEAYNYLMTFPSKAKAYEGKLNDSNSFSLNELSIKDFVILLLLSIKIIKK